MDRINVSSADMVSPRILWLRPSKGDNISVRRERIAEVLREEGFEIDIQDASRFDSISAIYKAIKGDYDLIAGNVRIGLYLGYPLAKLLRVPFVGTVSDPLFDIDSLPNPVFKFFEWYEWYILRRADRCSFVYESSYEGALRRGIDDAVKLPNAVDFEAFAEPEEDSIERAREILIREGVNLQKRIAIYIGVFAHPYNITDILDAAPLTPDWEFVFLGEGDLENEVARAAESQSNVYFPGAFEYELMPGFLSLADVGFCFKDAEQPLKLKEYGASGLATIAQPGELQRWYSEDELLFVPPTAEDIANELTTLSQAEIDEKGMALRQRVAGSSWDEIAEGYREIFVKAIEAGGR